MKVILLADVKTVGKKGEIVEVSDAFARNVLLRKKQAVEANSRTMNDLKLQKAHEKKVAEEQLQAARDLAGKLEEKTLELSIKVGENGRTFGAVSTKEIAQAAFDQFGFELDKKKIVVDDSIRTVGDHVVKVKLHPKVTADLKVRVNGSKS